MNKEQKHMKDYWSDTTDTLEKAMYMVNSSKHDWKLDEFLENGKSVWEEIYKVKNQLPDSESVLEIGCGLGRLLNHTTEEFKRSYGCDIDYNMIKFAREIDEKNIINYEVVDGTGELSMFFNNSFSFIYSFICFQHIPYLDVQQTYIKEIERILKPNGIASLLIQNRNWGSADNDISLGSGMSIEELKEVTTLNVVSKDENFLSKDGRNYLVILKKGK